MPTRKPRLPFASAWFFPAAALYAALLLPVSVLGLLGLIPTVPGLAPPIGHAQEMLFGFALAVVAGYLLGPQPPRFSLALFACWVAARTSALFWPGSWVAITTTLLFATGLAWKVLPRFVGAAKKWRNQCVAPAVAGLALLSVAASWGPELELARLLQQETLILLAMLMFFMGGRIIAPALAGLAKTQGRQLNSRTQPSLEGAALVLLALSLILSLMPWTLLQRVAGAILVACGMLAAMRLLRWQPWHCRARMDLVILLLGYAWLALGMLLLGLTALFPSLPKAALHHALTVGALGSLTFAVMTRMRLMQRFHHMQAKRWIHPLGLLISLAALARIVPTLAGWPQAGWLLLAACFWSIAFLALVVLLWQCRETSSSADR